MGVPCTPIRFSSSRCAHEPTQNRSRLISSLVQHPDGVIGALAALAIDIQSGTALNLPLSQPRDRLEERPPRVWLAERGHAPREHPVVPYCSRRAQNQIEARGTEGSARIAHTEPRYAVSGHTNGRICWPTHAIFRIGFCATSRISAGEDLTRCAARRSWTAPSPPAALPAAGSAGRWSPVPPDQPAGMAAAVVGRGLFPLTQSGACLSSVLGHLAYEEVFASVTEPSQRLFRVAISIRWLVMQLKLNPCMTTEEA